MFSSTPWGGAALSRPGRLSRVLCLRQNFDVARCEGSLDAFFFRNKIRNAVQESSICIHNCIYIWYVLHLQYIYKVYACACAYAGIKCRCVRIQVHLHIYGYINIYRIVVI